MSLSYGLLGLINNFPLSGYDLKKIFDDSIRFFWVAKMSQIYRELKSLEENGDIISKIEPGRRGPVRRVYSITKKGKANLQKWLINPPEDLNEDFRNVFLIRLFISSEIGFEIPLRQIEQRLTAYKKELDELITVEAKLEEYIALSGKEENMPFWKIVLGRGKHVTEANIRWAEESIHYLKKINREKK